MSLAADSRELADEIARIRRRHQRKPWGKYPAMQCDLVSFLGEAAFLLRQAAKILEGA